MRSPSIASAFLALILALGLLVADRADAAIYFRSAAVNQTASTGAASLSLNVPSGTAAGDVMVAAVSSVSTTAPATPTGWTKVTTASASYGSGSLTIFTRVAGTTEPASYSFTLGGTFEASGEVSTYLGVNNTTPVQVSASATGNSKTLITPSVTTTTANDFVISAVSYNAGAAVTITNPAGTTERGEALSTGTFLGTLVVDELQAAAGASGGQTFQSPSKIAYGAATIALAPASPGPLSFAVAPNIASLPGVTLNGQPQTVTAQMPGFEVDDATGTTAGTSGVNGWNVTVMGDATAGKSDVFKRYCPNATCGSDSGPAYVAGGASLPYNSLTFVHTGASFAGGVGSAPTFQCPTSCNVDGSAQTRIVSAPATGGGMWTASGFAANSLRLSTATTLRVLPANEIYRVDLLWTLNTGP
jgi:hypothetical protein